MNNKTQFPLVLEIDDIECPTWNTFYAGVHWAKRKDTADLIHQRMFAELYSNKYIPRPIRRKVELEIEIHYKDRRNRDVDNACVKPFIDGLKLFKVLKDDSVKYVDTLLLKMKTGQPSNKVIITIK